MSKESTQIILSEDRGLTRTDWLQSKHSFNFGNYFNLNRLNFGTLCVLNEDTVKPKKGFGLHEHKNMEIVTIVLKGELAHEDSTGNKILLKEGEIQRMSAGSGIHHSEYNASATEPVHFLQIWVYPKERNLPPSYEQKSFNPESFQNTFYPVVANVQDTPALFIHQDATFFLGNFDAEKTIKHRIRSSSYGDYIFIIEGEVLFNGQTLKAGDAIEIKHVPEIEMKTQTSAKILLIEIGFTSL